MTQRLSQPGWIGQYATRLVSMWQPRTPIEEEYCAWGVIEMLAAKVAEASARVVAIWKSIVMDRCVVSIKCFVEADRNLVRI